ncbi:hypothetical protein VTH06DRAFT_2177 [Thermothelomyces fergusii]
MMLRPLQFDRLEYGTLRVMEEQSVLAPHQKLKHANTRVLPSQGGLLRGQEGARDRALISFRIRRGCSSRHSRFPSFRFIRNPNSQLTIRSAELVDATKGNNLTLVLRNTTQYEASNRA